MEQDHNEDDYFDGISDELIALIFSKVLDAKSLCRCYAVSKRFASLIPLVDAVVLTVPLLKSKPNPGIFLNFVNSLVTNFIAKPLQFLHQKVLPQSSVSFHSNEGLIYHYSREALKNFNHITALRIQLPGHGGDQGAKGTGADLLKWEAEFGRDLESCVVLGATSFHKSNKKIPRIPKRRDNQLHESGLATDELKLRVAWMISCLFAASSRHCLLKRIVADNPLMLQNLVMEDGSRQGRLHVGEEQLKELRECMNMQLLPLERTKLPAICIKLWHLPLLELPASGSVMKGATLILIRPAAQTMKKTKSDGDVLAGAFGGEEELAGVFCEAVKELVKEKKPYLMEMNPF